MECHDARLLLSFTHRRCEELDATEREALQHHLDKCPDCASVAQADRHMDGTFGRVMRDVPVPVGLKDKLLKSLPAQRQAWRWRRPTIALVAAAMIAGIVTGAVTWYGHLQPEVKFGDVKNFVGIGSGWPREDVEKYFHQHGLNVKAPESFDYSYLQRIDIVEFMGQRVPKLTFASDRMNTADVLVLSARQFRLNELPASEFPDATSIKIEHDSGFTYLIFYHGELHRLRLAIH